MNTSAELVVGIFIILDRMNPDFDTKTVWSNLKQKTIEQLVEIHKELNSADRKQPKKQ